MKDFQAISMLKMYTKASTKQTKTRKEKEAGYSLLESTKCSMLCCTHVGSLLNELD